MKAPYLALSLLTAGLLIGGCGGASDPSPIAMYQVTITNLTNAQPMSPMAVVAHHKDISIYTVGTTASIALEQLAESGENTALLDDEDLDTTESTDGVTLPGESSSITLAFQTSACISVASMLVNTNDAFTGADCIDISDLKKGSTKKMELLAYDAGTEENSERASTIPGPAGDGVGFDAARDDRDVVTVHGGIVSADDGLTSSILHMTHRWDNPVATLSIERLQ